MTLMEKDIEKHENTIKENNYEQQKSAESTKRAYNELNTTVDDTATKRARETDNKTSKHKFSEDYLTEKEFLDQYGNPIFRLTDTKGVMSSLNSIHSKDLQLFLHAEAIVQQLWHFFVISPLHVAILAKIQSFNDEDHLKLKRVVTIRWLSYWESVVAVIIDLPSIWIALEKIWNTKFDSTAHGLLNQTKKKQIILCLFILRSKQIGVLYAAISDEHQNERMAKINKFKSIRDCIIMVQRKGQTYILEKNIRTWLRRRVYTF
ncbi:MAG: hypothetical protein EZS28_001410 [Streblomastix strix]|uniref:Uncharacterized protein n=1 Tax=Streblomastix strix TaxID=222440 RepID=A0A5J4X867_9EUKA|nr:MAG: hypothetical protein EZS28_001410 [Streblomastix strix]